MKREKPTDWISNQVAAERYGLTAGTINTYRTKGKVAGVSRGVSEISLKTYLERRQRRGVITDKPKLVRVGDEFSVARRRRFWENLNAIAFIPNTTPAP